MLHILDRVYHLDQIQPRDVLSKYRFRTNKKMNSRFTRIIIAIGAVLMSRKEIKDYTKKVSLTPNLR